MDQLTLSKLLNDVKVEQDANKALIQNYLEGLIGKGIATHISIDTYSQYNVVINIEFLAEADNLKSRYFGADISLDYCRDYDWKNDTYSEPVIRMNTSSCGSQSRQENPGIYYRAKTQLAIWDHEEEFKALLNGLHYECVVAHRKALNQFEAERKAKEAEEKAQRIQKFESQLVVGKEFNENFDDRSYCAMITNITPKRVYFNYGETGLDYYYSVYVDKEALIYHATNLDWKNFNIIEYLDVFGKGKSWQRR